MENKHSGKVIYMEPDPAYSDFLLEFVKEEIEFTLTDDQWSVINLEMEKFWNTDSYGDFRLLDDSAENIYNQFISQKVLIPYDRILEIVGIIWDYLEIMGDLKPDESPLEPV